MYYLKEAASFVCGGWSSLISNSHKLQRQSEVNIWQIPFKHQFCFLLKILHANMATEDVFIFCYWFCLVTAFIGFVEAFMEFVKVYSDEHYLPKTLWNREYHHIPFEYRRKARIVGSGVNIAVNLFFLYGFFNLRHMFLIPWIAINSIIVVLESFFWITNAVNKKTFKLGPLLSLTFLILRFTIVFQIMLTIADLDRK